MKKIALAILAANTLAFAVSAADIAENPLRNLYYGELHMHTAYSLDAYIGGTRQTPDDAYRAAKGETVVVNGQPHQIRRPLDFAAVTDHAEYIGEMYSTLHQDAPGHDNPLIQQLRGLNDIKERELFQTTINIPSKHDNEHFAGISRWVMGSKMQENGISIPLLSGAIFQTFSSYARVSR